MAFERAPIFKFNTINESGFNKVPIGSMIMIEDTSEILIKENDGGTTVADAMSLGVVSSSISNTNIFNYLYYADEADSTTENPNGTNSRILGMDPITMKLEKEIKLPAYAHPGSCDRAASSDKMYVRSATTTNPDNTPMSSTGGDRYMAVVDMVSKQFLKKIPLNWKPRSSGAYNRYRDMHAVTTKERPWIHLIDCPTDRLVFSAGSDNGSGYVQGSNWNTAVPTGEANPDWNDSPQGNDGGNATGHAVWLDANHFALLDRHNVNIQVFKIDGGYPPYTVTKTQTIPTPSGSHSLRSFESGLLLNDNEFCCAIEGSFGEDIADSSPEMWRMFFNAADGKFYQESTFTTEVLGGSDSATITTVDRIVFDTGVAGSKGPEDSIHHFGTGVFNGQKVVCLPLSKSSSAYMIDVDSWNLDPTLMPIDGYYALGGSTGKASAGHADYCSALGYFVITNHKGKTVPVINLSAQTHTEVAIPTLTNAPFAEGDTFVQSHANHVIGTRYYFFDAYLNEALGYKGTFYELELDPSRGGPKVNRLTVTGGHPVQSFS